MVIAHVGGRYADIKYAHDGRLERAVEVHSTWGTFEWLLHDAFEQGYRVGVVCHSDDHKGRPGATRPGASTFGAIGGLTCYLMPELTRDALFEALRARRHYGTTGTRLFLDLARPFAPPVTGFSDDPQLGPAQERRARGLDGRHHPPRRGADAARRRGHRHRADRARRRAARRQRSCRRCGPLRAADLGRRVRVIWQGAEYRGRGRETMWQGKLTLTGNRIARFAPVNFLNPERKVVETEPRHRARLDLGDHRQSRRHRSLARRGAARHARASKPTSSPARSISRRSMTTRSSSTAAASAGASASIACPKQDWSRRVALEHDVTFAGGADLPVYVRVTQSDGHQAWSSPIYLIA